MAPDAMNVEILTGDGETHTFEDVDRVSYDAVRDLLRVEVVSEGAKVTVFAEKMGDVDKLDVTLD